jgi:hypothetical protein
MIGIVLRGGLPVRVAFDASTAHNCIESEVHLPGPLEPSSAIINAEMALTVTLHFRKLTSILGCGEDFGNSSTHALSLRPFNACLLCKVQYKSTVEVCFQARIPVVRRVLLRGCEPANLTYNRRSGSVGLWVSPLRRGSSEGLPAALTRRRRFLCTTHFRMYEGESVRCLLSTHCVHLTPKNWV